MGKIYNYLTFDLFQIFEEFKVDVARNNSAAFTGKLQGCGLSDPYNDDQLILQTKNNLNCDVPCAAAVTTAIFPSSLFPIFLSNTSVVADECFSPNGPEETGWIFLSYTIRRPPKATIAAYVFIPSAFLVTKSFTRWAKPEFASLSKFYLPDILSIR